MFNVLINVKLPKIVDISTFNFKLSWFVSEKKFYNCGGEGQVFFAARANLMITFVLFSS